MENKTNQEMRELYRSLDIVTDINKKKIAMIGYVVRMDQGRIDKKVLGSKLEGNRRSGRPKLRWLEDVETYLWERKVKRLQQNAVDREEWESVITEPRLPEGRRGEE